MRRTTPITGSPSAAVVAVAAPEGDHAEVLSSDIRN
jgi:hypothetical protein